MRYFEVESRSEYYISYKEVELEECGDDFMDEDEMRELGLSTCRSSSVFKNKIKNKLEEYMGRIAEGKKSIKIDDQELIQVMKDEYISVSELLGYGRRVGDRLFKGEAKSYKKPRSYNSLLDELLSRMENVLYCSFDIKVNRGVWRHASNNMDLYKKMVS